MITQYPFKVLFLFSCLTLHWVAQVGAFGHHGHYLLGEAAFQSLSVPTQNLLKPMLIRESLGATSVWADAIKFKKQYSWTRSLHYYDTDDNPPQQCGMPKEMAPGDHLFSALQNFTQALELKTTKFHLYMVVHLLQDMHQPLHLSGKLRGGNGEKIVFPQLRLGEKIILPQLRREVSLHEYYDVHVVNLIQRDRFKNQSSLFLQHLQRMSKSESCPTGSYWDYARELEKINCDLVWKKPFDQEYIEKSQERMLTLMVQGTKVLTCYLEQLFEKNSVDKEYIRNKDEHNEL